MVRKIITAGAVVATLMFSGCSLTASYATKVDTIPERPVETIGVMLSQDSTSLGFIAAGDVTRTNYKYAFATIATGTLERGYKYFTVSAPEKFVQQLTNRNVSNFQEAYDACNNGSGSFTVGFLSQGVFGGYRNCDSIVIGLQQATLTGGTVLHKWIHFEAEMHNDARPDSHTTFDAQEILKSDLLDGLNKEYFVKNNR